MIGGPRGNQVDWQPYLPGDDLTDEAGYPFATGTRVRVRGVWPGLVQEYNLVSGSLGTVVCQGRSRASAQQFRINRARAQAAGAELTADDYDCLIDGEGPVVEFDNGEMVWFPGQSMTAIEPARSEGGPLELVVNIGLVEELLEPETLGERVKTLGLAIAEGLSSGSVRTTAGTTAGGWWIR